MRSITLLLASMALMVCVAASVALAVTKNCNEDDPCFGTNGPDTLIGSDGNDHIFGLGGPDTIRGREGEDEISGGGGGDELRGGADNDTIFAGFGDDTVFGSSGNDGIDVSGDQELGFQDKVFCGPGLDVVILDENDDVVTDDNSNQDCEVLIGPG